MRRLVDEVVIRVLTVFIGLGLVLMGLVFPNWAWSLLSVRCMYGTGCIPKSRERDREKARYLLSIVKKKK